MKLRNMAFATMTLLTSWFALAGCQPQAPIDSSDGVVGEAQDEDDVLFCGGIATIDCPDGYRCVDDPSDDCLPNKGGSDCDGMCIPAEPLEPTRIGIPTPWPIPEPFEHGQSSK